MKPLVLALSAACLVLVVAAACGGDEQATPAEPPAPPPAESVAPPEPAPEPPQPEPSASEELGPDGLPRIVVDQPAPGSTVTSPVTISGNADVFEANVAVTILDADGNELVNTFTTATCGTGCRGDYTLDVEFTVPEEQPGTIVVFEPATADEGPAPPRVEIAVTLAP
jgi:Immunoglobulin-like domain of bacterial spore germination